MVASLQRLPLMLMHQFLSLQLLYLPVKQQQPLSNLIKRTPLQQLQSHLRNQRLNLRMLLLLFLRLLRQLLQVRLYRKLPRLQLPPQNRRRNHPKHLHLFLHLFLQPPQVPLGRTPPQLQLPPQNRRRNHLKHLHLFLHLFLQPPQVPLGRKPPQLQLPPQNRRRNHLKHLHLFLHLFLQLLQACLNRKVILLMQLPLFNRNLHHLRAVLLKEVPTHTLTHMQMLRLPHPLLSLHHHQLFTMTLLSRLILGLRKLMHKCKVRTSRQRLPVHWTFPPLLMWRSQMLLYKQTQKSGV
jgi:hypothetical protein